MGFHPIPHLRNFLEKSSLRIFKNFEKRGFFRFLFNFCSSLGRSEQGILRFKSASGLDVLLKARLASAPRLLAPASADDDKLRSHQ